jgi:hypothetical protein
VTAAAANGAARPKAQAAVEGLCVAAVPRLALDIEEACLALGVGWDFWKEHIAPDIPIVRRGRRKLIAIAALERWLADNGERLLDDL